MQTLTVQTASANYEVQLGFFHTMSGHGHWNIVCEAWINPEFKTKFKYKTSNSSLIDSINELKQEGSHEELQSAYFEDVSDEIINDIQYWVETSGD